MNFRKVLLSLGLALTLAPTLPQIAAAAQITQYFPADGQPAARLTQWRIVWGIESQAGGSEVLAIKEAWFSRGPGEPEIQVLGDSRLAELLSAYNRGARLYDISGFRFPLVDLDETALGPGCLVEGRILNRDGVPAATGPVAVEVHDDHLRWMDTQQRSRRGQALEVWSVLNAFNYRYVILYIFRDDGQIGFRVGATANNLAPTIDDEATHVHSGCWRINVALGNQIDTSVRKVTLDTNLHRTVIDPLTTEARFKWNPEEFTRLRVESTTRTNAHEPPHPISYDLMPMAMGAGRFYNPGEEFTLNDFWVTVNKNGEVRCPNLDKYENGQNLIGALPTIWYEAGFVHSPRDEDFGKTGYVTRDGVALTTWGGFDLKPRNFFSSTPLYP
jgi:Copper amine oxidase, enzyme domain